jgi:hypothetical protein
VNRFDYLHDVGIVQGLQKWLSKKLNMGQAGISLLVRGERGITWSNAKALADLSDPKADPGFFMEIPAEYRQRAIHYHLKKTFLRECFTSRDPSKDE